MISLVALLVHFPGVVCHELAHHLFCLLASVRVYRVVYYRFGDPAGYVVHASPRHLRSQIAITAGPLIVNSVIAYVLFLIVVSRLPAMSQLGREMQTVSPDGPQMLSVIGSVLPDLLIVLVSVWVGLSVAGHAFPSQGDAQTLWSTSGDQFRRGNILALWGFPLAGLLYLLNWLKLARLHWLYVAGLWWLSWATSALVLVVFQ